MCSSQGLSQVREQMEFWWCQILGIHTGSGQMCSSQGLSQVREQMEVWWCKILGLQWMINKCKAKVVNCCHVDSWRVQGALLRWNSTRSVNVWQRLAITLHSNCHNKVAWHCPVTVVDHFYIALFSTLEQTHCARMWFYMSEQLFIAHFWISTEVLQCWHGWCHMKLLAISAHSVYTIQHVTSRKATYVRCCNLPPALLAEWLYDHFEEIHPQNFIGYQKTWHHDFFCWLDDLGLLWRGGNQCSFCFDRCFVSGVKWWTNVLTEGFGT